MFQTLSSSLMGNSRGRHVGRRRGWQRSLVLFTDAKKGDSQLRICRNASKNSISQLDILLPAGIRPVDEVHSGCDDGITEEPKASSKSHSFHCHVRSREPSSEKHR